MNGGIILNSKNDDLFGQDDNEMAKNSGDTIPREPEKMKLMGHRAKITKIAFHPIYT
jgi:hypothetical protein